MATQLTWLARGPRSRWFSVCLLLTVFFLPLHFHAISPIASQLTKECICLHGSKTQANLTSDAGACASVTVVGVVALVTQVEFASESVRIPSSRAPPA